MQDISVIEINKEGKWRSKELPKNLETSVHADLFQPSFWGWLSGWTQEPVLNKLNFGNFLPLVMKQNAWKLAHFLLHRDGRKEKE